MARHTHNTHLSSRRKKKLKSALSKRRGAPVTPLQQKVIKKVIGGEKLSLVQRIKALATSGRRGVIAAEKANVRRVRRGVLREQKESALTRSRRFRRRK